MDITTPHRSGTHTHTHTVTSYLMEMKCPVYLLHCQCRNLCPVSSSPCHGSPSTHGAGFLHKDLVSPAVFFKSLSSICCRRPCRDTWRGVVTVLSRQRSVCDTVLVFLPQDSWQFWHWSTVTQFRDSLVTHFAFTATWPHFPSINSSNVVFVSRLRCHCAHSSPLPAAAT
jgi:hypothetical protein